MYALAYKRSEQGRRDPLVKYINITVMSIREVIVFERMPE